MVLEAVDDLKALEPVVLDVRGKTGITDLMIVVTGNSARHVRSIADNVVEKARARGLRALGKEGTEAAEWVLVDLGDVVVHVMQPKVRELYRLERIWGIEEDDQDAREAYSQGQS
ncbi:MAG: ribosome silencing factor [Aquisalimonadaceae bacterium]